MPMPMNEPKEQKKSIFVTVKPIGDWLRDIGLESLKDNFIDVGFQTADEFKKAYCQNVTSLIAELLYKFGIDKIGYRSRIMMHLSEGNLAFVIE